MKYRRSLEVVATGLAAHAGCIAACLGVGAASLGSKGCTALGESGHPLQFLFLQLGLLLLAILVAYLYLKSSTSVRRYQLLFVLFSGLFVPMTAKFATVGLQAVFLVQISELLFKAYKGSCCKPHPDLVQKYTSV